MAGERKHPKGLMVLFFTEVWERYNYYGMRAILVLFMTKTMLFDKVFSSNLYSSYTSLVYLTPLLGGYISDQYWGNKRSIIVGGIVMALGEFVLFFCGSFYHSNPELSSLLFFTGLGIIIAGNGFFKPNIASMVGQLYPKGDRRVDSAYTIFYMGINLGAAIGPIVSAFGILATGILPIKESSLPLLTFIVILSNFMVTFFISLTNVSRKADLIKLPDQSLIPEVNFT